jgi:hypothetical protein
VGSTIGLGHHSLTVLYSNVQRDAILSAPTPYMPAVVSSVRSTGLHRTQSEREGRSALNEQSVGINWDFRLFGDQLTIGLNGLYTAYDARIVPTTNRYNQFHFRGTAHGIGGIYSTLYLRRFKAFSEYAYSANGGHGLVAGFSTALSGVVEASMLVRNYDRDFHSPYSTAFGERSSSSNEKGVYTGLKIKLNRSLVFNLYAHRYYFPWLKYRVDAPSEGYDLMLSTDLNLKDKLRLRLILREEQNDINVAEGTASYEVLPARKRYMRLQLIYPEQGIFDLTTRIQYSTQTLNGVKTEGFLVAQDVGIKTPHWQLFGRISLFDADDFDTRQFVYERDVLYRFSVPSFFDSGVRYYLVGNCKIGPHLQIWAKIAATTYADRETIGSGQDEISGNQKHDITLQAIYRFR